MDRSLYLILGPVPDIAHQPLHAAWSNDTRDCFTARLSFPQVHSARGRGLALFNIDDPIIALAGWSGPVSALAAEGGEPSGLFVHQYDRPTADVVYIGCELIESLAINVALVRRSAQHGVFAGTRPIASHAVPTRLLVARRLWEAAAGGSSRRVRVAATGEDGFSSAALPAFAGWETRTGKLGDVPAIVAGLVPLAEIATFAGTPGLLGLTPELGFGAAGDSVDVGNDLRAPSSWPVYGGEGEVVVVLDGGFHVDDVVAPFVQPAVAATMQLDYWNGYSSGGNHVVVPTATTDETGHASMVAGLIAGKRPGGWPALADGHDPVGIAPDARVVLVSLGRNRDPFAPVPGAVARFDDALAGTDASPRLVVDEVGIVTALGKGFAGADRARIACMAFERELAATELGYDVTCAEIDDFAFHNRRLLIVAAAGNVHGEGEGPIRAPGAAKNALTVGAFAATEATYKSKDGVTTEEATETIAWSRPGAPFNAPGAGSIGVRPDVIAPGGNVLSYRSVATHVWDAGDVPQVQPGAYAFYKGTSVACALTAGVVANLRSRLVERWDKVEPTAAAIKALLIAGAAAPGETVPEVGAKAAAAMRHVATPTNTRGWGRIDVTRTLFDTEGRPVRVLDAVEVDKAPLVVNLRAGIVKGERPVVATLVWTDRPSRCLGGGWVAQYVMELVQLDAPGRRCLASPQVTGSQVVAARFDPAQGAYQLRIHALTEEAVGGRVAVVVCGAVPSGEGQEWRTA